MATLMLRFPAGRYHATPSGHHVNEGLIEWPPSPWRILRALLSVGYTKLGWDAGMEEPWRSSPPDAARSLFMKLAAALPTYSLPAVTGAHSRHWMPVGKLKGAREDTTLVFDTWAQLAGGELAVKWDVELDDGELTLLGQLADHLGYLGRSESWVTARLLDPRELQEQREIVFDCVAETAVSPGPAWEQVGLLAPLTAPAYDMWREAALSSASGPKEAMAATRSSVAARKKMDDLAEPYPQDLLACLQVDTAWLRKFGWSQPPGSRRVLYWRRSITVNSEVTRWADTKSRERTEFVLLSMTSQTGNDHALPSLVRSLPQGEMLHRQAVAARMRFAPQGHSPALTGCDELGVPLRGRHAHAHVLSLDLDGDGHMDHLLVWAPGGLDSLDLQALRWTRRTYTRGGVGALRLGWAGAGERKDLRALASPHGDRLGKTIGCGRVWTSATPFVPPRHVKVRGSNSLEGQVLAELASRGLPAPEAIEVLDPRHDEHARVLRLHTRVRRYGDPPPVDAGFALRMHFEHGIDGPLCLGYASHFGLGRFECE